jgi:hypothetical protein
MIIRRKLKLSFDNFLYCRAVLMVSEAPEKRNGPFFLIGPEISNL